MKEQDYSNALTIPEDIQKTYLYDLFLEIIKSCLDMSSYKVSFQSPYVELKNIDNKRIFKKIGYFDENGKRRKIFTKQCIRDIINLSYANNKIEVLYEILINSRIAAIFPEKTELKFEVYKNCLSLPQFNSETKKYELNNCNSSACVDNLALDSNDDIYDKCKSCPIKAIYYGLSKINEPIYFYNILSSPLRNSTYKLSSDVNSSNCSAVSNEIENTYNKAIEFEQEVLKHEFNIENAIELLNSCKKAVDDVVFLSISDYKLAYIYLYYNQLIHWPILRNTVRRLEYICDDIFIFSRVLNPASFIIRNCYKENSCEENLSLFIKIEQARIVSFLNAVRQTPFDNYYNNIYLSDIIATDMALIQEHKEKTLSLYIELINLLRYSQTLIDIDVYKEEQKIENLLTEYHSDDDAYIRYYLYKYMFGYNDIKNNLTTKFCNMFNEVVSGKNCNDSIITLFNLYDVLGGFIEVNVPYNICDMLLYLATENTQHDPLLELSSPMSYIRVYGDKILVKYYKSFYCNAKEILNKIDSPLEKKNQ